MNQTPSRQQKSEMADDAAFRQAVARKSGKKICAAPLSKEAKARRKKKRILIGIGIPAGCILLLGSLYLLFVYSSAPFITRLRTVYIETAMSTGHHHWLAEAFIPKDIIDSVMQDKEQ